MTRPLLSIGNQIIRCSTWLTSRSNWKSMLQKTSWISTKLMRNISIWVKDILYKTLNFYDVKLTGKLEACDGCMWVKAWVKNLKKKTKTEAMAPCKRFFLDATGPFPLSIGRSCFDAKTIDQFLHKAWTAHIKFKVQITDMVKQHLDFMKGQGNHVKYLWCDNVPKHGNKLANICKECGIDIQFTAPYTPQLNGVVEHKIITDHNWAFLAMLFGEQLTKIAQALLQAKAKAGNFWTTLEV